MSFFDKLYLSLFTKSATKIVSPDGYFEFEIPEGFRFKQVNGIYQILTPNDKTFLFQWSGHSLTNDTKFEFDVNIELERELKNNPNAVTQLVGMYNCVCSAIIAKDRSRVYKWKLGEKNKRALVTLLLARELSQDAIAEKILLAKDLITKLHFIHTT
jgi:hypothetical protein